METTLSIIASITSILAAGFSIGAAIHSRAYRDQIKTTMKNTGGINFNNVRSEGNGGDGFRIVTKGK